MTAYYFDEDVSLPAATLLRARGYDVVTYAGLSLQGAEDYVHFLNAAETGRALVTHNRKHFVLLHGAWFHWSKAWDMSRHHSGILILEQPLPVAMIAEVIVGLDQTRWILDDKIYYWRRRPG